MEAAKALIRSAVRQFYDIEHIIVVDALMIHSALRDEDIAFVMGQQVKPVRRLLGRLKEDGIVSVHSRQEIREGYTRPVQKDYFYINFHKTIDVIKYRLYKMTEHIKRLGLPTNERKELICPRCKSQWTSLEAADNIDMTTGDHLCHKCNAVLQERPKDDEAGGENDMMKRFNQQLAGLMTLMQNIDDTDNVPENDFESALGAMVPLQRDQNVHPTIKYEVASSSLPRIAPEAVRGLANTGPREIAIDITTNAENAAAAASERSQQRDRLAAQNALPAWHTRSTITGDLTAAGTAEEVARQEREREAGLIAARQEDEDKRAGGDEDQQIMNDYYAQLRADEAREREKDREDDEEEEEDDDEDDEEGFVDVAGVGASTSNGTAPGQPSNSWVVVNGAAPSTSSSSAATSPRALNQAESGDDGRDSKRVKTEGSKPSIPTSNPDGDDDGDDEDDFEDVM